MNISRTAYNQSMAAKTTDRAREFSRSMDVCALRAAETARLDEFNYGSSTTSPPPGHCGALVRSHWLRARIGR